MSYVRLGSFIKMLFYEHPADRHSKILVDVVDAGLPAGSFLVGSGQSLEVSRQHTIMTKEDITALTSEPLYAGETSHIRDHIQ